MEDKIIASKYEADMLSAELLKVVDLMEAGLVITDPNSPDNPVIFVNKGFTRLTGYEPEEILYTNCRRLQGPETGSAELEVIRKALESKTSARVTLKNYKKDGSAFWNQLILSPIFGESGTLVYFVGLLHEVSQEVRDEEIPSRKIRQLAFFDPLTGVLNTGRFRQELENAIESGTRCAIIRINIDRFRYINESYGEEIGDSLLQEAAERMRGSLPEDSLISRSFADDFTVMFKVGGPHDTSIHADVLNMWEQLHKPYFMSDEEIHANFSFGTTLYPDHGETAALLLSHADLTLKKSKQEYLGEPGWFNYSMLEQIHNRMQIEKKMPKALEAGEFELYFQPKGSSALCPLLVGIEVLLRWNDPEKGLVPPMDFIPIAEENGFIIPLGAWILMETCRIAKAWQDAGYPKIPISVNVSAVQFRHPQFLKVVEHALEASGLDPCFLELEVTETMLNDPVVIKEKLERLKNKGIKISIDDFGTGYSSIHYLKTLPIDILKIDKSFVQATPSSEQDSTLLQSIIRLGKSFGLTVLAEGVESQSQLEFLTASGCDLIQGYYYSRPLNRSAMEQMFAATSNQRQDQ